MIKTLPKKKPFYWTLEADAAFKEFISLLTTAPILALPDPQKPYILFTDASNMHNLSILSSFTSKVLPHNPSGPRMSQSCPFPLT
jgi:hypothetical protein